MGGLSGAGAVLAAEVCAPLLLLCWLCCWPDEASDTSSGKYPTRPNITNESSSSHRRLNELFRRRCGSSAVSLHMPSTSGTTKQPTHRSHEEIRGRRRSHLDVCQEDSRYHSAPSVIHEVVHRRDWERSAKELYIPLRPEKEAISLSSPTPSNLSLRSLQRCDEADHRVSRTCKKHFTNIKCSKKKETDDDVKDDDVTESSCFYIGDNDAGSSVSEKRGECDKKNYKEKNMAAGPASNDSKIYKHKETKQSLNECIKSKDRMRLVPVKELVVSRFEDVNLESTALDRSGAQHHGATSEAELLNARPTPPSYSVEPLGYTSDTSYLDQEVWVAAPSMSLAWSPPAEGFLRARHASAGDVLAPTHRPQSGALSESDIDFELESCDELPPPYHEVHLLKDSNETAI